MYVAIIEEEGVCTFGALTSGRRPADLGESFFVGSCKSGLAQASDLWAVCPDTQMWLPSVATWCYATEKLRGVAAGCFRAATMEGHFEDVDRYRFGRDQAVMDS